MCSSDLPQSIFNHKKHLSNNFYPFSIFRHLKIRKYKNTFTSCIHNTKPKIIINYCFHHPCIFIYHHCIFIYHHCIFIYCFAFIIFSYHSHTLCLAGFQEKDKKINLSLLIPREFDIKPLSHPSWGKLSFLYYTLCTWSLNLTIFF